MGLRTFLALDLDGAILDRLDEARTEIDDPRSKVRWVARENLHLTLRFLGEVSDEMIAGVCELAAGAAGQVGAFDFDVRGIACIPPRGQIRMIWAQIDDPTGEMAALHEILSAELSGLGLKEDARSFKPHVTIARVKFIRNPDGFREVAADHADTHFGTQHAEELVTYSSKLTPGGPIYTPMARARLGG
jgi:2'-5' RNA ligase